MAHTAVIALALREEAAITLQAAARRRAVQYRMRSPFYRACLKHKSLFEHYEHTRFFCSRGHKFTFTFFQV